jgi:hypothetical protein
MAGVIYLLCAATALTCAVLLWRSYRANRARLLYWSGVCFFALAVENLVLYIDQIALPGIDLSAFRHLIGLVALSSLIYGLVWDTR